MVMWMGEEEGFFGVQQYYNCYKGSVGNFSLVMEFDEGMFKFLGFIFKGSKKLVVIMSEVMKFLGLVNVFRLVLDVVSGDIGFWVNDGVFGGFLDNVNSKYFYFYYLNGDIMIVEDLDVLDLCVVVWVVVVYIVVDLEDMLL